MKLGENAVNPEYLATHAYVRRLDLLVAKFELIKSNYKKSASWTTIN